MSTRTVNLPSGAQLEITVSPFEVSKNLYMEIAAELKSIKLDPKAQADMNFWKELLLLVASSKRIESCIWACMDRVTYNKLKVDRNTFEPVEARVDYIDACYEVALDNVRPFMKSLYAQFTVIMQAVQNIPA